MKTNYLYLVLVLASFMFACQKESKGGFPLAGSSDEIDGEWNLILATGGLAGISQTYAIGEIQWTFDSADSLVTVMNASDTSVYYSLPSGVYPFFESEVTGDVIITVNNEQMGTRTISNDTLDIGAGQIILDGFSLKFVR